MRGNCFKVCSLIVVVIVCAGFISCASTSFAGPNSVQVPSDFFGISPDRSPLNPEDYILLDEFNAAWIRTTIHWSSVEPEQGKWMFDRWDNYVAKAEAAEKKVIFILGFDNGWLFKDNKERRKLEDEHIPLYLNYVEQVVNRYGTRVVYEIWNEPNVIFWRGSNKQFYKVSKAAAERIRETLPEATIIAGSTFRIPGRFIRGLFKAGAMEHVDGFSAHPYGIDPIGTLRLNDKLRRILNENDFDKPAYLTEVGYFTGPRPVFSTDRYAEYIVKTLSGLAVRADDVRNVIWYELMNDYNPGEVKRPWYPLSYMGLIYPNRTPKIFCRRDQRSRLFLLFLPGCHTRLANLSRSSPRIFRSAQFRKPFAIVPPRSVHIVCAACS